MCDIISLYQKNKGVLSMNILSQILNYETKNLFIDDILEKMLHCKTKFHPNLSRSGI